MIPEYRERESQPIIYPGKEDVDSMFTTCCCKELTRMQGNRNLERHPSWASASSSSFSRDPPPGQEVLEARTRMDPE